MCTLCSCVCIGFPVRAENRIIIIGPVHVQWFNMAAERTLEFLANLLLELLLNYMIHS